LLKLENYASISAFDPQMRARIAVKAYMHAVILCGAASVVWSLSRLDLNHVDVQFLLLAAFTLAIGSRITVPIPRLKSHISVSDTFIFLTLLIYGGELAILLAAAEATVSSWRFCKRNITILFNSATMAVSTTCVFAVLLASGLYSESNLHAQTGSTQNFVVILSIVTLVQFGVNTLLATTYDSLRESVPFWETWTQKYIWTFVTYFFGVLAAGFLLQISDAVGLVMLIAVAPVVFFVYLTYKMFLRNIESSLDEADQAEKYARRLEVQSVALRESEERFRSAFDYAPIGIALVGENGKWLKVNRALTEILGYDETEFFTTDFRSMIFPEDLGVTLVKIADVESGAVASSQMEHRYFHKSGRTVWASWSVSTATGESITGARNLIFQVQDITDKKLAEERLHHDATHDALTGLANRALFMRNLTDALKRSHSKQGYKVSVLFIDLDRFKNVNDSLGHVAGDQLLIAISERLRSCLRPRDMVARLGGDEFVILVEGTFEQSEVVSIAERVQDKFSVPFRLKGNEIYSSASIGILNASEKHTTAEEMMRDADTAMYQAKRAGRARHEIFDEEMHRAAKETFRLETDLRRAIENDDLLVYYQPIFSLATGEVEGFEALVRWFHPELGEIPPLRFVSLAEEIGLIDALGEKVLARSCREFIQIQAVTPDQELYLSANLSWKQFANPTLVEGIQNILSHTGFSPRSLKLEITESVFFEYQQEAIEMLGQLRAMGIELNIDDFGTGYSNLSYLATLPISSLKIDRSFVSMFDLEGESNPAIAQTIILLARNLGLRVVAEGVETTFQYEELKRLECDSAQGYYLSLPLPMNEAIDFVKDRNFDRSFLPKQPADNLLETVH
jgi:diguanylate cyclase (GGDEF)-like protein/PAS domain S-box-containing protein